MDTDERTERRLRKRRICFLVEGIGEGTKMVSFSEADEEAETSTSGKAESERFVEDVVK